MFFSSGSAPSTSNPSRAIGSDRSPPPQPMSSRRQPLEGPERPVVPLETLHRKLADELQPNRVELVQRRELAVGVPPFGGHPRELGHLGVVHGRCSGGAACLGHRHLPKAWRAESRLSRAVPASMYGPQNPHAPPAMAKIVMKFGGTSVADIARIRNVARLVKREVDAGHEVAVVVSAMAGETNKLVAWTRELRRCTTRASTTRWSPRASRSPPGSSPSRCRRSACRRAPGWAGRFRSRPRRCTARRASSTSTPRSDERAPEAGPGRSGRRVSGYRARQPHLDARPRRLGHQRRRAGRGAEGRPLRHLYRCRRRLHDRPAHRLRRRDGSNRSPTKRCWKWPRSGAKVLQTRSVEMAMVHRVPCACYRPSMPTGAARFYATRKISWKKIPSPASPIRATKPRSRF